MIKPTKELEEEIMEFIFSNKCENHELALSIWNNNPWEAVSLYEIAHYPENLGMQLCFPKEVEVPEWLVKKLSNEETLAMQGDPVIIKFPRAKAMEVSGKGFKGQINKFGRLELEYYDKDDEDDTDF